MKTYAIFPVTPLKAAIADVKDIGWVAKVQFKPGENFDLITMIRAKSVKGLKLEVKHRERPWETTGKILMPVQLSGNTTIDKDTCVKFHLAATVDTLRQYGLSLEELLSSCDLRLECTTNADQASLFEERVATATADSMTHGDEDLDEGDLA